MTPIVTTVFAVTLALATAQVTAEPLTFRAALARTRETAPALKAADANVMAARQAAPAASQLPDPTLDVGIRDFPVTGPDAGTLNRDNFTMTSVGVSQLFVHPAKRQARATRAMADVRVAEAEARTAQRAAVRETALAWIDLHFARRQLAALGPVARAIDDVASLVAAQLVSGRLRPTEALAPDLLRAQLADRRNQLQADIARAQAQLARNTGDPAPDVAGPVPAFPINPAQLQADLDALPAVQVLTAQSAVADADTALAQADTRPDWTVSASYGRREPAYGDLVSLSVSVDLPFFKRARQQPRIAARASAAQGVRFASIVAQRDLRASLDSDLADHALHQQQLERARDVLVPLAARRVDLERASYAGGKTDVGAVLMANLASTEVQLDVLAREAVAVRDAVRISLTYGGDPQ